MRGESRRRRKREEHSVVPGPIWLYSSAFSHLEGAARKGHWAANKRFEISKFKFKIPESSIQPPPPCCRAGALPLRGPPPRDRRGRRGRPAGEEGPPTGLHAPAARMENLIEFGNRESEILNSKSRRAAAGRAQLLANFFGGAVWGNFRENANCG